LVRASSLEIKLELFSLELLEPGLSPRNSPTNEDGWKVGNGPANKWLNFGDDPDHRLDKGIVFRIRHYWEIWKVVNGHSFILIR